MPNADELRTLHDRALGRWEYLQRDWRRRARFNKGTSMLLVYLSVTMAVTAIVLAAAPAVPKWTVAVVSGGTALATTLLAATKAQEHWALARSIQVQLHAERFLYEQQAGRYAPATASTGEVRVRLSSERITEIALAAHDFWAAQVVTTPATAAAPPATPSGN